MTPLAFELTSAEREHPLWLRLRMHLEARLKAQLDELSHDQTEQRTALIRGHVRCLKEIIRLGLEPPQV